MKKKSCPSMFDFLCPAFNSFNLCPFVSIRGFYRLGTKKRDSFESLKICCRLGLGFVLFPGALEWLGDEALLDGLGGDADVLHLAIDDGLDALQVRQETAFHDLGDVHADAALFLGLTAAANAAPCDGAGAC